VGRRFDERSAAPTKRSVSHLQPSFRHYSPKCLEGAFSGTQAVGSTHLPGDIICTGTPGAVIIQEGDVVECRITGFEPLSNPVVR
jgi:hypothetical protein